jgi:hypothetical protein
MKVPIHFSFFPAATFFIPFRTMDTTILLLKTVITSWKMTIT